MMEYQKKLKKSDVEDESMELDFDEEELTTIDTILGKDPGHMIR
mgnify:CR=1 FL=1